VPISTSASPPTEAVFGDESLSSSKLGVDPGHAVSGNGHMMMIEKQQRTAISQEPEIGIGAILVQPVGNAHGGIHMKLEFVEISGFRGFRDKTRFEFPLGFAVLSGGNGAGKSTVLDAVDFALTRRSISFQ